MGETNTTITINCFNKYCSKTETDNVKKTEVNETNYIYYEYYSFFAGIAVRK